MGKLIDVDKFLERVKKDREHEIYLHSWTADMVLKRLDSWYAPTVEAVPKSVLEDIKAEVIARMWNWRSKNTISIDKVAMETILNDVFEEQINEV